MENRKDQNIFHFIAAERPKLSRLVAFIIGAATTLVFAPTEWSLLAPLLALPLSFIALTVSPKDAAAHYFWFGFGLFLTGTHWIYISVHVFGHAPVVIAVLLMVGLSLTMAAFLWLAGWLTSRLSHGESWRLLLVAPAAWVIVEWLRGWILTGFPWLAYGYGQIDSSLAGWAPVLGVYGVSFAMLFSTVALLVAFMTSGRGRLVAGSLFILPWLIGGSLKTVNWTENYGQPIRATIVQGGVPQDEKWLPERRAPTLAFYQDATLAAADSDLVIWPEVAIPALHSQVSDYLAEVHAAARLRQQTVLLGILQDEQRHAAAKRIYNSVFLLGGEQRQVYRKRHLVPFGEYFPVPESVREWMRMRNLPYSDLAAGDDDQALLVAENGARLAIAVCYEDAYGAEQLYAFPGADLLINVSNDAWFGDSIAPHQHLQIARMRALEVGRYAVRSTNTGISAFIGPDGALLRTGRQFASDVMTMDIHSRRGMTLYANYGNRPVIGLCFLILGIFWIRSRTGL